MLEIWRIESSPNKQTALSVIVILAGLILAYGFRNFDASGMTNSLSGFLLGVLLLIIGVPCFVMGGKQKITIDPAAKIILIEDKNRFRQKKRLIVFSEITGAHVSEFGKRSNGTVTYYVSLNLKSGKTYPLFYPAYYEGRWSRMVAESRLNILMTYLHG